MVGVSRRGGREILKPPHKTHLNAINYIVLITSF